MAADVTAAAAASAAAGTTTVVLGAWLGIDVQALMLGLLGAALGITFVREPIGAARAALAFLAFGVWGALAGTLAAQHSYFAGPQTHVARNLMALIAAAAGHPLLMVLLTKIGPWAESLLDRVGVGGKKP